MVVIINSTPFDSLKYNKVSYCEQVRQTTDFPTIPMHFLRAHLKRMVGMLVV